ncbi:MAG: hypothetical protein BWY77_01892 [bacterium ADurb.Bin431]|nr:MAG: hypothetical protein BWY77_01892 [bacterium ADurb.Bin431]
MQAGQHPCLLHPAEDRHQICVAVLIGEYLPYRLGPRLLQLIDLSRAAIEGEVYTRAVPGYLQLLLKGSGVHSARHGVRLVYDRRHPTRRRRGGSAGPVLLVIGPRVPEVHMNVYRPRENQHSPGIYTLFGPVGAP